MKRNIIIIAGIAVVLLFSFLYINQNYLMADDRDGKKECSDMSKCDDKEKNKEIKAGSDLNEYVFATDQACCDEMKADLQTQILGIAGVKEVSFGETCGHSKMTQVKVFYNGSETTEDVIAASVNEKNVKSEGKTGCDKNSKSGKTDGMKECPSHKNKDSKDI
jgi:hypothetical protein